eukprot:gb/GECG01009284.1/.p1 GENE.gb/GECG01009284.1/~~gb/GECG01009284.1/.p1  ORF type:complete len:123 (+),score=16.84 gb/GECG01009284.1/:1-369(+)
MPQKGPKGFRFSDLSKEHQKAVQWYMKKSGGGSGLQDTRCRQETKQFLRCIQRNNYDQAQCNQEIFALKSCIDNMEADPGYTERMNKAINNVRQDVRTTLVNSLRDHPLTWKRSQLLKKFLR